MVILGKSTKAEIIFPDNTKVDYGIESIDFSYGANIQRLYAFGGSNIDCNINEYSTIQSSEIQINFNIYGGITPEVSLCVPDTCRNSDNRLIVTIIPAACFPTPVINVLVFINSYSYTKERYQVGKESWSCTGYDSSILQNYKGAYIQIPPTYTILNLAEGNIDVEDININIGSPGIASQDIIDIQNMVGAQFRNYDLGRMPVKSYRGSASAGGMGLGEMTASIQGSFKAIGNSTGWDATNPALNAKANVSITNNKVYVG